MLTREHAAITVPHRTTAGARGDCCHLPVLLELDHGL